MVTNSYETREVFRRCIASTYSIPSEDTSLYRLHKIFCIDMNTPTRNSLAWFISLLITLSGFAALSWEVIWQIKSTLALGVSAWGAAIT